MNDESLDFLEKKLQALEEEKKEQELSKNIASREEELQLQIKALELELQTLELRISKKESSENVPSIEDNEIENLNSDIKYEKNPITSSKKSSSLLPTILTIFILVVGIYAYNLPKQTGNNDKISFVNTDWGTFNTEYLRNASEYYPSWNKWACLPILLVDVGQDKDFDNFETSEISIILSTPVNDNHFYKFALPNNRKAYIPLISNSKLPVGLDFLYTNRNFARNGQSVANTITIEGYTTLGKSFKKVNIFSPDSLFFSLEKEDLTRCSSQF